MSQWKEVHKKEVWEYMGKKHDQWLNPIMIPNLIRRDKDQYTTQRYLQESDPEDLKETATAINEMRKIFMGGAPISKGKFQYTRKGLEQEVNFNIPIGYVAVVNNKTKEYTRLPEDAFYLALKQSGLTDKQQAAAKKKFMTKDREFFTTNEKILRAVGQNPPQDLNPEPFVATREDVISLGKQYGYFQDIIPKKRQKEKVSQPIAEDVSPRTREVWKLYKEYGIFSTSEEEEEEAGDEEVYDPELLYDPVTKKPGRIYLDEVTYIVDSGNVFTADRSKKVGIYARAGEIIWEDDKAYEDHLKRIESLEEPLGLDNDTDTDTELDLPVQEEEEEEEEREEYRPFFYYDLKMIYSPETDEVLEGDEDDDDYYNVIGKFDFNEAGERFNAKLSSAAQKLGDIDFNNKKLARKFIKKHKKKFPDQYDYEITKSYEAGGTYVKPTKK
jgi:hypothetical protein